MGISLPSLNTYKVGEMNVLGIVGNGGESHNADTDLCTVTVLLADVLKNQLF